MCGFIGIIASSTDIRKSFEDGLAAIKPRGITTSILKNKTEQLGYTRLPTDDVTDVSLGRIDTTSEILLFNGLITNVDDLADIFSLDNSVRRSDNRCLRSGLSEHGGEFLKHVRGMFAAAFITNKQVMLVRDTVGIKPLYYVYENEVFAFASELKALLPLDLAVHEVPPGHIIIFDKDERTLSRRTFSYSSYRRYGTSQLEECLRESVIKSTERYLRNSKKSVALLLSGGVDSSINAALLMNALSPDDTKRLVAFCVGDDDAPDVLAAKRIASTLKLKLVHVYPYSPEVAIQRLPEIVYATESPYPRVVKVALLYAALAASIKKHRIDVVIGGEGADELFHGYHRFINGLTHHQSKELFTLFFRRIFHYTLLQRYDRIMARQQIEGRVPYLDQELIELAAAIPPATKVQHLSSGYISKVPLRDMARQIGLPSYIYDRGKEKMTAGATGQENSTSRNGYLEREAITITGKTFQQLVEEHYQQQFGDMLVTDMDHYTEEQAMELADRYKANNLTNHKEAISL
jgi:asparagine synthase (glutamine-hydrolysing)